jgi:MarR family transcriptional regulator for hemolysin
MNPEQQHDRCGEAWEASGLGGKISPSLLLLGRLVGRRLERALVEGGLGITPAQARVLIALHFQTPLTQAALALQTGVDPSTLVSTLDTMEREGMAVREPSPDDRRAHLVSLTPRGERRVPRLFDLWDVVEEELTRGMAAADRRSLIAMLKVLIERLYAGDPPCG